MKILLVSPPYYRLMGIEYKYFHLGLGYLASVLREAGFEVGMYNLENAPDRNGLDFYHYTQHFTRYGMYLNALQDRCHPVWEEARKTIKDFGPDVLGISVKTPEVGAARAITQICKDVCAKCKVVWGGFHPTALPHEVMEIRGVDFVVRGEGEYTLLELCLAMENGKMRFGNILGLTFRKNGNVVHNPARPVEENLDRLPHPARDLVIYPERYSPSEMAWVLAFRGSAAGYDYVGSHTTLGRGQRYRSIPDVIEEVRSVMRVYGGNIFEFWPDMFTANRSKTNDLCHGLIQQKLGISWICDTHVDSFDEELIGSMKTSGLFNVHLWVESGSEKTLEFLRGSAMSPHLCLSQIDILERNRISVMAYFFLAYPKETADDFEATIDVMTKCHATRLAPNVFRPYPGTPLHSYMIHAGYSLQGIDWSRLSPRSPECLFEKTYTQKELSRFLRQALEVTDRRNCRLRSIYRDYRAMGRRSIPNKIVHLVKQPGLVRKKAARLLTSCRQVHHSKR
jgi:anaerobic magnesium-protoporphyrin IX monomethyl ester cyclase